MEGYPGTNLGMTATNHVFNMSSPGPLHDSHLGQSWPSGNNQRVSREGLQDSSSEEDSSSDSEEDFVTETHQRRKNEDLLSMNSFPETNEDVDPTEEEYFRFLEVTERHRKNRDGDESKTLKKFDFHFFHFCFPSLSNGKQRQMIPCCAASALGEFSEPNIYLSNTYQDKHLSSQTHIKLR